MITALTPATVATVTPNGPMQRCILVIENCRFTFDEWPGLTDLLVDCLLRARTALAHNRAAVVSAQQHELGYHVIGIHP